MNDAWECAMHGFQTPDVVLDILADLHFEEAKPFRIPSARQGDGLVEVGDGNRDVRLSRSHIRATPELPHRMFDVRQQASMTAVSIPQRAAG
jgi:hypothetical protein